MTAARGLAAAALAALLAGCATPAAPPHPLAGRIVHGPGAEPISSEALLDRMAGAQAVLLGEKHDNEHHHDLELRVLDALVARGLRPALGLEVFSTAQTGTLMRYAAGEGAPHQPADPEAALRRALGWDDAAGELRWEAYGPLLRLAREHGLPVFGADLPVSLRRRIAQVGIAGLNGVERSLLPPTPPAADDYAALMRARIRAAHCGYGSDEYIGRLLENWTARNETMARAVAAMLDDGPGPVVLVVGAGHLRQDLGLPQRLARLRPQAAQVNLGLREVDPAHREAGDYTGALEFEGTRFAPDHPYLWFTPRAGIPQADPCAFFERAGHEKKSG